MIFANSALVRQGLEELSDREYQERVWTASSGPEISSLTEAISRLFDDSGLDLALGKGSVFGDPVDRLLKQLGALLDGIPDDRPPAELVNDPRMLEVRERASIILMSFP